MTNLLKLHFHIDTSIAQREAFDGILLLILKIGKTGNDCKQILLHTPVFIQS